VTGVVGVFCRSDCKKPLACGEHETDRVECKSQEAFVWREIADSVLVFVLSESDRALARRLALAPGGEMVTMLPPPGVVRCCMLWLALRDRPREDRWGDGVKKTSMAAFPVVACCNVPDGEVDEGEQGTAIGEGGDAGLPTERRIAKSLRRENGSKQFCGERISNPTTGDRLRNIAEVLLFVLFCGVRRGVEWRTAVGERVPC
jgi:hypothetical protein